MKKVLFLLSFLVFLIPFILADDSQFSISCGGDNQLTIGCIGDNQDFLQGNYANNINSNPIGVTPDSLNSINLSIENLPTQKQKVVSNIGKFWIFYAFGLFIFIILYKNQKKGKKEKQKKKIISQYEKDRKSKEINK